MINSSLFFFPPLKPYGVHLAKYGAYKYLAAVCFWAIALISAVENKTIANKLNGYISIALVLALGVITHFLLGTNIQ